MNEAVKDIKELKERGLYIIEDDEIVVEMLLPQVLKEKGLQISDLARLTGISRQNINAVIRNKMKPGIDFVLKVSFVLGEPIDNLFTLTDNAWVKPYKVGRDSTVFYDALNSRLVDNAVKREQIKQTGAEYFDKETKQTYTKTKFQSMLKAYVEKNLVHKEQEIRTDDPELSRTSVNSFAVEELKQEFNSKYSKIYKKLGEKFEPYTLNNSKR